MDLAERYDPINRVAVYGRFSPGVRQAIVIFACIQPVRGDLLEDLSAIPQGQITLDPTEILTMRPPDDKVADSIADVSRRSPIEVWLNGLQSIGSWNSFLGYAWPRVLWCGLGCLPIPFTCWWRLCSLPPFGGPAMNASLASASGDRDLLRGSVLRYAVGLLVLMLTTFVVSLLLQLNRVTNLMMDVGQVRPWRRCCRW
jgi:hypothetical protein